uniref:Ubiquitin-like domain-containing protein n=1 Tax=Leersia perrieri TaxID=77586 RepID=A0A0D9X521_9ORYZ
MPLEAVVGVVEEIGGSVVDDEWLGLGDLSLYGGARARVEGGGDQRHTTPAAATRRSERCTPFFLLIDQSQPPQGNPRDDLIAFASTFIIYSFYTMMQIFYYYGKRIPLEVDPFDTIDMVKSKIEAIEGIPPEQQELLPLARLNDDSTLADHNIKEGTTLVLFRVEQLGPPGHKKITMRTFSGETYTYTRVLKPSLPRVPFEEMSFLAKVRFFASLCWECRRDFHLPSVIEFCRESELFSLLGTIACQVTVMSLFTVNLMRYARIRQAEFSST